MSPQSRLANRENPCFPILRGTKINDFLSFSVIFGGFPTEYQGFPWISNQIASAQKYLKLFLTIVRAYVKQLARQMQWDFL